jgi:Asp-tRNA(Asn)/Glu-tRNA(Gln) amidotransferase A subunit family amidase
MYEDALMQARELDREFQKTGQLIGPLHGIPITLKDQFNIRGYDTTLGYVGRAFHPAEEDAVLLQLLKSHGAVVIAKTNLPQSIMVSRHLIWLPLRRTDGRDKLQRPYSFRLHRIDSGAKRKTLFGV